MLHLAITFACVRTVPPLLQLRRLRLRLHRALSLMHLPTGHVGLYPVVVVAVVGQAI